MGMKNVDVFYFNQTTCTIPLNIYIKDIAISSLYYSNFDYYPCMVLYKYSDFKPLIGSKGLRLANMQSPRTLTGEPSAALVYRMQYIYY